MAAPLRSLIRACNKVFQNTTGSCMVQTRSLTLTYVLRAEEVEEKEPAEQVETEIEGTGNGKKALRMIIDPATSIRYLNSEAFVKGYGDKPVWFHYRRNFKGQIPPKTRKTCVRKGVLATASPCPICRDEYLVLDSKNIKLLEQFISAYTGEIFDSRITGLCQKQHKTLLVEVMKAWNEGLLEMKLPFRHYDYEEYKH